ncbi:MAG: sortase [Marmoricola sp.]
MTAIHDVSPTGGRREALLGWTRALPKVERSARTQPPNTVVLVYSWVLTMLAIVLGALILNVTLVSQFQHSNAQHKLYDELRVSLAEGSTPIGQLDVNGHVVKAGTPVALLKIPELGIKEVVVDGTASRQTKTGVGHEPDTRMPGQAGQSVLMGRAAAYGGVFKHLDRLKKGDEFTVLTGQGESTYRVIGPRVGTAQLPALTGSASRLTLMTATGAPFFPHKVLQVDAALVSPVYATPPVSYAQGVIDDAQKPLGKDPSRLFSLSWLLELLVLLVAGAIWARHRWSHQATWIVFAPVLAATGFAVADRVCDLLPNLM